MHPMTSSTDIKLCRTLTVALQTFGNLPCISPITYFYFMHNFWRGGWLSSSFIIMSVAISLEYGEKIVCLNLNEV